MFIDLDWGNYYDFSSVNYKVSSMSDYFIANRFYVDVHYSKSLEAHRKLSNY